MDGQSAMTLDEPVWQTVKRDLAQVGSKLQVVLLPRENQDGVLKKLKDCESSVEGLCCWLGVGGIGVGRGGWGEGELCACQGRECPWWNRAHAPVCIGPHSNRGSVGAAAGVPHAVHVRTVLVGIRGPDPRPLPAHGPNQSPTHPLTHPPTDPHHPRTVC